MDEINDQASLKFQIDLKKLILQLDVCNGKLIPHHKESRKEIPFSNVFNEFAKWGFHLVTFRNNRRYKQIILYSVRLNGG